jgi:Flp pilus assembly protein TadG
MTRAPAPKRRSRQRLWQQERGSALIELQLLGFALLLPLVAILLTVLEVQRASYAATHAAREAGRVAVVTFDESLARAAVAVAFRDQGVPSSPSVTFRCAGPCQSPGSRLTVTVSTQVRLPWLPAPLRDVVRGGIGVQASHVATFDRYRAPA